MLVKVAIHAYKGEIQTLVFGIVNCWYMYLYCYSCVNFSRTFPGKANLILWTSHINLVMSAWEIHGHSRTTVSRMTSRHGNDLCIAGRWCVSFLFCQFHQTVKQTLEWPVIWDALPFMWRRCNGEVAKLKIMKVLMRSTNLQNDSTCDPRILM